MDKSEQAQLVVQVKTLEGENLKLKEDLAFFESLLPVDNNAFGVSIRRMKAEVAAPNQLHYQLLIMQGGKVDHDFSGDLQLTVTVLQAGKSAMIVFPEQNTAEPDKYKLTFKHYQRAEGVLTLPDGAVAKSVQARVLDKGQIRAQLSMNL
jgi:1-acyl-sn-glycerol-3-phosphate acyltransferase